MDDLLVTLVSHVHGIADNRHIPDSIWNASRPRDYQGTWNRKGSGQPFSVSVRFWQTFLAEISFDFGILVFSSFRVLAKTDFWLSFGPCLTSSVPYVPEVS